MRFPGFSDEWKKSTLKEECIVNPKTEGLEKEFLYIDLESVVKGQLVKQNIISRDEAPSRAQRVLSKWDIIYQCVRPYQLNNYIIRDESTIQLVASTGYAQIRTKHNPDFIYQLLHTKGFTDQVINRCTGTNYPAINSTDLSSIEINFPGIQEQAKIGELLTIIDQRIAIQSKVIEDCTTLEKEIQNLVFSRINAPLVPLSSISERVSEKNSALESDNVLTISAREGLVSQLEFFNKSVASENLSNYYLLRKGDFAYNKSYSSDYPWGAIKHLERYITGVLSPLYFCFRPNKEIVDTRYLQFFFDTNLWHKHIADIAVEGARNHGLLNMTVGDFYTMPILLPTMKEQKEIAEKLSAIREKRVVEESIYRLFLQQKRYLLEKLFV